jgi:hypothetical protein
MFQFLITQSSVNGQVGCLHILVIVNDAAINMIQIHILISAFNSWGYILRNKLLNHKIILF